MFLPLFSVSPEEIFSGEILLFDVDFFNPQREVYAQTEYVYETSQTTAVVGGANNETVKVTEEGRHILVKDKESLYKELKQPSENEQPNVEYEYDEETNEHIITSSKKFLEEKIKYYYYLRDENLGHSEDNKVITSAQNSALVLQPLVSQWYNAIRNIAIVAAMSVLLYIGIRMMLSVVAQEKAKYRQMLVDWIVGVCLLFFMHYIMAFSVTLVGALTELVSYETALPTSSELKELVEETGAESQINLAETSVVLVEDDDQAKISSKLRELGKEELIDTSTTPAQIIWPTNLMGMVRLKAQVNYGDIAFVGYGVCYLLLVLFTLYFTFVYLKRVLYMAFLTMIAPLVALTYPIDKIHDGQAQGFNRWLKEYIFNLLIQPLHLLLYTVLVTSAYDLASTNVLYSIVAIGFLIPAEELMRSLFGFEKAKTPPSAAGIAAGAALLNTGFQSLFKHKPSKGGSGGKGGSRDGNDDKALPRTGYKDDALDDVANEGNRPIGDGNTPVGDGGEPADAGGANQPEDNAPAETIENPMQSQRREFLERQLANGQLREEDLTDEQRRLLGLNAQEQEVEQETDNTEHTDENTPEPEQPRFYRGRNGRLKLTKIGRKEASERMSKYMLQSAGRNALKGLKKTGLNVAKYGSKAAVGAMLAAPAAAIGATIGLATGDPNKVLSFGGGAGFAAGTLGASMVNPTGDFSKSATQIARERAYWGDLYDQHQAEENARKWKRNSENRAKLEQYLSEQEVQQMYDNGEVDDYLAHNVTNAEQMVGLHKVQSNLGISRTEALAAREAEIKYKFSNLKPKDKDDVINNGYVEEFKKRNQNLSDADARIKGANFRKSIEGYADALDKLQ